jgi:hypothetical protein
MNVMIDGAKAEPTICQSRKIAVINHYGDEVLKVFEV